MIERRGERAPGGAAPAAEASLAVVLAARTAQAQLVSVARRQPYDDPPTDLVDLRGRLSPLRFDADHAQATRSGEGDRFACETEAGRRRPARLAPPPPDRRLDVHRRERLVAT